MVHTHGLARRVVILLFCACLCFTLSILRTASIYTPILEREIEMTEVTGTLEQLEYLEGGKGFRGILRDVEIENVDRAHTPRKVRLKLRPDETLVIGQRIKVLAGLNPPSPPVYPGGFDFQRYSFYQGLGAIGFSYKKAEVIAEHEGNGIWDRIEDLRFAIGERILKGLPEQEGPIANALMTGLRAAISEADNLAIQNAGLAHMLSISGLHISLLFGAIFFYGAHDHGVFSGDGAASSDQEICRSSGDGGGAVLHVDIGVQYSDAALDFHDGDCVSCYHD